MSARFFKVDYSNVQQANVLLELMAQYALDPMGGGVPLSAFARDNIVKALADFPDAFSVLGMDDDTPVALANCFRSLSTFTCRPLINIHDFFIVAEYRGQSYSQRLLAEIEAIAREQRCCKLTVEVLENNAVGRAAYSRSGFVPYSLGGSGGSALFLQKALS